MCPSISPDCHLLVLELVLVLRYHFISSGQINTHRCSMHCAVLSRFSHVQLFVTLWTVAHQLPLSMGFSRQGYWSGLPFPSPEDLPNPGIKPESPALQVDSLPSELPRKPQITCERGIIILHFEDKETESQGNYVPVKVAVPFMERNILLSSWGSF